MESLVDLNNLAYVDLSSNELKRRNQLTTIEKKGFFDKIYINW